MMPGVGFFDSLPVPVEADGGALRRPGLLALILGHGHERVTGAGR